MLFVSVFNTSFLDSFDQIYMSAPALASATLIRYALGSVIYIRIPDLEIVGSDSVATSLAQSSRH